MPSTVFLSFATENKNLANLFRGQAQNKRLDLEFRDYSIKEPLEGAWKTRAEKLISLSSATICLVGQQTYQSDPVNWEIRKSLELGKPVLAVCVEEDVTHLPEALSEAGITPVQWDIDEITTTLEPLVKCPITEEKV